MSEKPAVSVLLSVLNPEPEYFREAVVSILSQSAQDLELIVVEDPSERSAQPILQTLTDNRVRYYRNPIRTSLVRQRNQALAHARADVVALIDADDIAVACRLEKQLRFLATHPDVAVVGTWIEAIDPQGKTLGYRAYPVSHEDIRRSMRRFNPIAQPSVMFRRQVILDAGGYTYDRHPATEDYELWSRLARRGVRFANLPEPLLRYRIHPGGMKTTRMRGTLRGTLEIKHLHWADELDLGDRFRCWAERLLLVSPASLVLRLFTLTHYQTTLPQSPPTG